MEELDFETRDMLGSCLLRRIELMNNFEQLFESHKLLLINQSVDFYKILLKTMEFGSEQKLQKDLKTIKILKKQLDSSITEGKVNEELMEYLFKTIHELNKYIAKVGEIL